MKPRTRAGRTSAPPGTSPGRTRARPTTAHARRNNGACRHRGSSLRPALGIQASRTTTGRPLGGPRDEKTGRVLLSQALASQVPSALRGLTALFGMGRGVSPSLKPPEKVERPRPPKSFKTAQRHNEHHNRLDQYKSVKPSNH